MNVVPTVVPTVVSPVTVSKTASRSRINPLGRLLPFLKQYPFMLGLTLVAMLLAAFATLALPFASRLMVDHGFSAADGDKIDSYFQMLIGIVGVLAVSSALRFYCVYWLGERLVADLKRDVFSRLIQLSADFYDGHNSGELMSRLAADTTLINSAIRASVSQALRNIVVMVGGLVMMVISSPQLSLMVIGAIPVVVLPLVFYGRMVRRLSNNAQETVAELNQFGSEMLSNVRTVQAFGAEGYVSNRFTSTNEETVVQGMKRTKARSLLTAVAIFLVMVSIVMILWYGARDVIAGNMSAGALIQFMLYAVFAGGSMGSLTEVWGEIAQAAGASERLAELLEMEPSVKSKDKAKVLKKPVRGEIEFKDVMFSYPERPDELVLNDVSFKIKAGERVAIVGPSGAGKSTLFQLLLRFYDPAAGSVMLDDLGIKNVGLHDLRASLALVPQEPSLFDASLYENIIFARPEAERHEVISAAQIAQADEFIQKFSNGYETRIGEGGQGLSGGQRQRIALARAILRDAPVLLLDEATSALDAGSEEKVQLALTEIMKNRTSLIIAHRLSTVISADRILVLDQGRIVEQGSHSELIAKGGLYAELARTQLAGEAAVAH